jgi:alkylhydroperoxidase family enzyme
MTPRDEQILGTPPRITPVSDLTDEMKTLVVPLPGYVKDAVPPLYGMLLHNVSLLKVFKPMSSHFLKESTLPLRDRELAILRIAWLCQAPYPWGEHCKIGAKVGLTTEEIERVTVGSTAPGWDEHDRALVKAAEELRADAMVSDDTWLTLAKKLREGQLLELVIMIGQYQTLAGLMNSVRLRLTPDNPGLSAR